MAITLNQAKKLRYHQTLYDLQNNDSTGHAARWRVNGMPKTWVTRPNEVQVPIKHGLYDYDYVTEGNLKRWSLTEPKVKKKPATKKKKVPSQRTVYGHEGRVWKEPGNLRSVR